MPKLSFNEEQLKPSPCRGMLFNMPFSDCELVTTTEKQLVARIEVFGAMQTIEVPETARIKNGLLVWQETDEERNIVQTIAIKF